MEKTVDPQIGEMWTNSTTYYLIVEREDDTVVYAFLNGQDITGHMVKSKADVFKYCRKV
jgi:hypothetical protein